MGSEENRWDGPTSDQTDEYTRGQFFRLCLFFDDRINTSRFKLDWTLSSLPVRSKAHRIKSDETRVWNPLWICWNKERRKPRTVSIRRRSISWMIRTKRNWTRRKDRILPHLPRRSQRSENVRRKQLNWWVTSWLLSRRLDYRPNKEQSENLPRPSTPLCLKMTLFEAWLIKQAFRFFFVNTETTLSNFSRQ